MARDEIAAFLEISAHAVERLWASGTLQRTLHCPYRPLATLNYSTVYDVIEYALVSGDLPVTLPRDLAALWVVHLAEANEWDEFKAANWSEQAILVLKAAGEDGLAGFTGDPAKVASVLVFTQALLTNMCMELEQAS